MTAFDYLAKLCPLRAWSSHLPQQDPLTPRVQFILDALRALGVDTETDIFPATSRGRGRYANVYARFGSSSDRTVMVSAHHDVSNPNSDNCQDNTASVAHLLALCDRFKAEPPQGVDIVVAFVDAEEIVDPPSSGAGRLAQRCVSGELPMPVYVLNLELTANGRNLWCERSANGDRGLSALLASQPEAPMRVRTPYNDAVAFRLYGLDSLCVGPLDDGNFAQLRKTGTCDTWSLCHSPGDSFELSARRDDMTEFGGWVERLLRVRMS